jgi:hypothetical protein
MADRQFHRRWIDEDHDGDGVFNDAEDFIGSVDGVSN